MDDRIAEDARAAFLAKVRQARAMSGEEKMLAGPRLFKGVCARMKEGIRDVHPEAGEEQIHLLLLKQLRRLRRLDAMRRSTP